jgi:hypothetical protein
MRNLVRALMALLLVVSAAACIPAWPPFGWGATPTATPSPTPTPTPTPTPSPTPSPTPMSTLDSFVAKVTGPDFQAQGAVSGTVKAATSFGSTSGPITGTFKVKGGDSDVAITTTILGATIRYDSIVLGGKAYSRTNGGSWNNSPASGKTLQGVVRDIALFDAGVQDKFGRWLHHLTAADISGIDPSAFGINLGADQRNLTLESLSFWAEADGTPAGVSLQASLDQKISLATAHETVTLDIVIESLGGVTISAPTN